MVRRRIIFALSAGTALLLGCGEDAQVTGSGGSTSSAGAGGAGQGGTTTGAGVGGMGSGGQGAGATGGGPPMSGDLPIGIPEPSFGWEIDTSGPATLWVDNQSPSCDDAVGSEAQPYCHLFRGQSSVSYPAGAVVHVLGGPYPIEGDLSLTFAGTEQAPVIIKGIGDGRILFDGDGARVSFDWEGSYGVLENIELFHKTRHRIVGDHLVFRNVGVTNPVEARIDFNPVVNVTGHDVLFHRGEIGNNRRDDDTDSHGIQAGSGSHHVFILENEIYNNNGDSFQGC
ncbi:MAG: hypothetical protein KC731_02520, partial [Myxococcales bacterium]|nr:hypothetical protein [Myxococcales bacterium]